MHFNAGSRMRDRLAPRLIGVCEATKAVPMMPRRRLGSAAGHANARSGNQGGISRVESYSLSWRRTTAYDLPCQGQGRAQGGTQLEQRVQVLPITLRAPELKDHEGLP